MLILKVANEVAKMNVYELINKLLSIENKSLKVKIFTDGDLGEELEEIYVDEEEVLLS